jgi:hypothetical protein
MGAKLTGLTYKIATQLHLVTAVPFAVLARYGQSGNFWIYPRILSLTKCRIMKTYGGAEV